MGAYGVILHQWKSKMMSGRRLVGLKFDVQGLMFQNLVRTPLIPIVIGMRGEDFVRNHIKW